MSTTEVACAERREAHAQSFAAALEGSFGADQVIGESPEWTAVLDRVRQVAATETTVCLLGESGTGREVLARLIHRASPRKDRPFVAIGGTRVLKANIRVIAATNRDPLAAVEAGTLREDLYLSPARLRRPDPAVAAPQARHPALLRILPPRGHLRGEWQGFRRQEPPP